MLSTTKWFVHYHLRIFSIFGPNSTTFWSADLQQYYNDLPIIGWQQIAKNEQTKLRNGVVTSAGQPRKDNSTSSNDDITTAMRSTNENSELEVDDEQIHADPKHNHGPGLEQDTILQLETQTETQRDLEHENET